MHSDDRIGYNTPATHSGADFVMGSVDEIVLSDCLVHIEMLDDHLAYFHLLTDQGEVRGHLMARPISRAERRQAQTRRGERLRDLIRDVLSGRMRIHDPWWRWPQSLWWESRDQARAALLITVEDDEIGLGDGRE